MATLPVTPLGVGIGVDDALYVLTVTLGRPREGLPLSEAHKFQADMGILLAFVFLWNMAGTLVLLPALACFLLPKAEVAPERVARLEQESPSSVP